MRLVILDALEKKYEAEIAAADATIKMQVFSLDADGGDAKLNDAQFTVIRIK